MRWQNKLMKLAPRTEAGLYLANKVTAIIAMIVMSAMVLLTVADVVGRYCFNSPIMGSWEIMGLLLICAGTWGLGYCQMSKRHISVTIIIERLSRRVQAIIRSAAYLIGFTSFSLICWQVFLLAKKYFLLTRGGVTATLGIPYYPFMLMLSISTGAMALILLIDLLHSLAEVARR